MVEDAILLPARRRDAGKGRVFGGAYRSDGTAVASSALWRGRNEPFTVARSRDAALAAAAEAERLPGSAVFAGWMPAHFGHFLLEGMARLWALGEVASDVPVLVEKNVDPFAAGPAREMFDLLGLGERLRWIDRPLRVDRLFVPDVAFRLRDFVAPCFVTPHRALAAAAPARAVVSRKLYLSRSRFPTSPIIGEAVVDEFMRRAGFTVVQPQELPLGEQIALARGAQDLAGFQGSAMHLALFAAPGTRIRHLLANDPKPNFLLLDAVCGHEAICIEARSHMVSHRSLPLFGRPPIRADLARVFDGLEAAGIVPAGGRPDWDEAALGRAHAEALAAWPPGPPPAASAEAQA